MLDLPSNVAWLSVTCGVAAFVEPHPPSNKPAPLKLLRMSTDKIFIDASFSRALLCDRASRDHRDAKIKWIDGNGHGVACAIVERPGAEIRSALKRHAMREIGKIRRIVD